LVHALQPPKREKIDNRLKVDNQKVGPFFKPDDPWNTHHDMTELSQQIQVFSEVNVSGHLDDEVDALFRLFLSTKKM